MTAIASASGRITGSAVSGSWKNYHKVGEHKHVSTLFLKYLYKMVNDL
jgi:hypothetical protein